MTLEFDNLVDSAEENLKRSFAEKHRQLRQTTEVFKQTLLHAKSRGWDTHAHLWNIGIYINIAAHDLSVLVSQLCFERDVWARKLTARHIALLIYEMAEDMRQLLGKGVREPLANLG